MEHLNYECILNLAGQRRAKLGDREHIVVPLTMIVPGVLNGSLGPILYTKTENDKSVDSWNGVPIVIEHPVSDGSPKSASEPEILKNQGVGTVLKAVSNGKLSAEGWFDIENLKRIAPTVFDDINAGNKVEVSTGLGMDKEPAENGATFDSQPYDFIARNYKPDHLAVLPTSKGACSIREGCGVNNQAQNVSFVTFDELEEMQKGLTKEEKETIIERAKNRVHKPEDHDPTLEDDEDKNSSHMTKEEILRKKKAKKNKAKNEMSNDEFFTVVMDEVRLIAETVSNRGDSSMSFDKEKVVNSLIENGCCWDETDRVALNGYSEEKLTKLAIVESQRIHNESVIEVAAKGFENPDGSTQVLNTEKKVWEVQEKEGKEGEVMNSQGKGLAEQPDVLTPEQKSTLAWAENRQRLDKAEVVQKLVVNINEKKKQTKGESLMELPMDQLENMLELLPSETPEIPNRPAIYFNSAPETVDNKEKPAAPLELTVMNFENEFIPVTSSA